ncbi:DUF3592 domain-containing protein [Roseiflexus sp.]|uniref:DUF3592 domain-containing protein n=1 Tax=Roseiflexus sp. TaxID=2562120 RepID=UPI00398A98D7
MLTLLSSTTVVGLLLLPMGLLILLVGIWLYVRAQRFVGAARQTTARVVDMQMDEAGETYYPIFEFTTVEGTMLRAKGPTGSYPPAHQVGDTVSILYDPQRPADVREYKFKDLWALPSIAIGFGGLFTLICLLLLLV